MGNKCPTCKKLVVWSCPDPWHEVVEEPVEITPYLYDLIPKGNLSASR